MPVYICNFESGKVTLVQNSKDNLQEDVEITSDLFVGFTSEVSVKPCGDIEERENRITQFFSGNSIDENLSTID